jgi:hypothetical protein
MKYTIYFLLAFFGCLFEIGIISILCFEYTFWYLLLLIPIAIINFYANFPSIIYDVNDNDIKKTRKIKIKKLNKISGCNNNWLWINR